MRIHRTLLAAAALAAIFVQPAAAASPNASKGCFYLRDLEGWKSTPDRRTLYTRVKGNRFFKVGLVSRCGMLASPNAFLATRVVGSDLVCRPVDWQLKVADSSPGGGSMGCIVSAISELSAQDVQALPKSLKP